MPKLPRHWAWAAVQTAVYAGMRTPSAADAVLVKLRHAGIDRRLTVEGMTLLADALKLIFESEIAGDERR